MQPKWQIETSHIVAIVLGVLGVGGSMALHFLTKSQISDISFVVAQVGILVGALSGILSPSPTSAGRIAAAAEVPGAVARVNSLVNDKIRSAATPAEGVPKL